MRRRGFLQKLAMLGGGAATLAATGPTEASPKLPRKLESKHPGFQRTSNLFMSEPPVEEGVDVRDLRAQRNTLRYWSRAPGKFVNRTTGEHQVFSSLVSDGPKWTGTVREWYECLVEEIISMGNAADGIRYERRRSDLTGPCFGEGSIEAMLDLVKVPDIPDATGMVYTSRDLLTILEQTTLYRSNYILQPDGRSAVSAMSGTLSNRYRVKLTDALSRSEILVVTDRGNVGLLTVLDMNIIELYSGR